MSTLLIWTGKAGSDWNSTTISNGTVVTSWMTPGGVTTLIPVADSVDKYVAVFNDGGSHTVGGGGSADQFTINHSTTVTLTGDRYQAGASDAANNADFPDDLVVDDGSKLVIASGAGLQNQGSVDVIGLGNDIAGPAGSGSLEIDPGGLYTTNALIIGDGTAGVGTVTINGALEFDVASSNGIGDGAVTIGNLGTGSLDLTGTPNVFTQSVTLGVNQGAVGVMSLDSSMWGGGNTTLGAAGVGRMTIGAGASVALYSLVLGSAPTGSGDLTVTGANSFGVDFLTVGQAGTGTATFGAGSTGTFAAVIVGDSVGAIADMTLDGATWNTGSLVIGFFGTGQAMAGAGEVVTVNNAELGDSADSSGDLTIDAASLNGGTVSVGLDGTGVLAIESGSTGSVAAVVVGADTGSSGTLTIDSSDWSVGSLTVGQSGTGVATVQTGATATVGDVFIGPNGNLAVTETAGSVGIMVATRVTIGFGTLDLTQFGQVLIGADAGTNGAVAIGNKASLTGLGSLTGNVVLSNGGQVLATAPAPGALKIDGAITGDGTIQPLMTLEANGAIGSGVTIGFSPSIGAQVGDLVLDAVGGDEGTITGFSAGNTIDIKGTAFTNALFTQGTSGSPGTLTLSGGGSTPVSLAIIGTYASDAFTATPVTVSDAGVAFDAFTGSGFAGTGSIDTIVTVTPCFAKGTGIATASDGAVTVEDLREGDVVITLVNGQQIPRPIKWIGYRHLEISAHPRPELVAPVRVRQSAFAEGLPHRDLLLSPDHALFVNDKLIPAKLLVNGMTIVQERATRSITYYHVELKQHGILLAEGLPVESYLDTGNRGGFENSGSPLVLHPDLTDETGYPTREAGSCMPFVWDEASVRPVWQRLADRAAAIGVAPPRRATTTDPNLRLRGGDGEPSRGEPIYADSNLVIFVLPRGAERVRLLSRAQAPTEARPWLDDHRGLGVRVKRIVLRGANELREIPMDQPDLTTGWWEVERDGQVMSRWTNGNAVVPLPKMAGHAMLEIHLAGEMLYVEETEPESQAERRVA
jgi:hypothetical protein